MWTLWWRVVPPAYEAVPGLAADLGEAVLRELHADPERKQTTLRDTQIHNRGGKIWKHNI